MYRVDGGMREDPGEGDQDAPINQFEQPLKYAKEETSAFELEWSRSRHITLSLCEQHLPQLSHDEEQYVCIGAAQ